MGRGQRCYNMIPDILWNCLQNYLGFFFNVKQWKHSMLSWVVQLDFNCAWFLSKTGVLVWHLSFTGVCLYTCVCIDLLFPAKCNTFRKHWLSNKHLCHLKYAGEMEQLCKHWRFLNIFYSSLETSSAEVLSERKLLNGLLSFIIVVEHRTS